MAIINSISTVASFVTGQKLEMNPTTYGLDTVATVNLSADVLFSEGPFLWPQRSVPEFTGPMGECSTRVMRRLPDHRCPADTVERPSGTADRRQANRLQRGTAILESKLNPNLKRSGYRSLALSLGQQPGFQVDSATAERPQVAAAKTTTASS